MDAIRAGRADLLDWTAAQPDDLYADDEAFQALVMAHGLQSRAEVLHATGRTVAGPLDTCVQVDNLAANLPSLDGWSAMGEHTAVVAHHPNWRRAGQLIYGTGIMAAYGETPVSHRFILGLFYLTAQVGEAGHNCPVACTAGAIRALQALGTPSQQERLLRPLLDPNFDSGFTASQFLTEVQGGSDVGANACVATPDDPASTGPGSTWRISGEKWFCSNADGDVFLMTARVGGPGTEGLGLFAVSRRLPDGRPNGFSIRRLKDKIGTRSMASAEMDFDGAVAESLGPMDRAFRNTMALVINTSRLYNAFGCAAHARRAWVVASTYAVHRRAFGQPIGRFAQVKETLAFMRADAVACLAGSLWLAELQERIDQGTASSDERDFFRVAINLNKMRTAMVAHDTVNRGIEVLGGNGTIETFSVMPRLMRDNIVFENWEGTHNVLRAQVLRDCRRKGVGDGFFALLAARLGEEAVGIDRADLGAVLALEDADLADVRFRRLADRLATLVMLGGLQPAPSLADEAAMTRRHLGSLPLDADYLALVERLQR